MIALYDHIQQLRAELSANPCPAERAHIAAELDRAEAQHRAERAAFEASFWEFEPPD